MNCSLPFIDCMKEIGVIGQSIIRQCSDGSLTWSGHAEVVDGDDLFVRVPPFIADAIDGEVIGCRCRIEYQGRTVTTTVKAIGALGDVSAGVADRLWIPAGARNGVFYKLSPPEGL